MGPGRLVGRGILLGLFVTASGCDGCGTGTSDDAPPTSPGTLVLLVVGAERIDLAWGNSVDEAGYIVERSPDGLVWTQIASLPIDATTYSALGLTPATTWWFRVQAWNGEGAAFTNAASAATPARAWDGAWPAAADARAEHSAIYDPNPAGPVPRLVVFGGLDPMFNFRNDTVALSLDDAPGSALWSTLASGSMQTPSPRHNHSAVYDPNPAGNRRMIVFGGEDGGGLLDEVWVLDLVTEEWSQPAVLGTPGARSGHVAVLDPVGNRMIVFGGNDGVTTLGDAWELSLTAFQWSALAPGGGAVPDLEFAAAVYDANPAGTPRMVVFAGNSLGIYTNAVWALSLGPAPAWAELLPSGALPVERGGTSWIVDEANGRWMAFGGEGLDPMLNPIAFDDAPAAVGGPGVTWSFPALGGGPPTGRTRHSGIYDARRARMILFGGFDSTLSLLDDVWSLQL
jgi:hypothetical protein